MVLRNQHINGPSPTDEYPNYAATTQKSFRIEGNRMLSDANGDATCIHCTIQFSLQSYQTIPKHFVILELNWGAKLKVLRRLIASSDLAS